MHFPVIALAIAISFNVAFGATIFSNTNGVSIYSNNGISIIHGGGSDYTFYCGNIICPKNTTNCRVVTKNSENNTNILTTYEQCTDNYGYILDQYVYETNNPEGLIIDSEININPEYVKRVQEEAQKIAEEARKHAAEISAYAQEQAANIQKTVHDEIRSAFSKVPLFKALGFSGFPFN